jgi:hypothetical protein
LLLKECIELGYEIETDFPHGFIAKGTFAKPASFCKTGYARYQAELGGLPYGVKLSVMASLQYQAEKCKLPMQYVEGDISLDSFTPDPAYRKAYDYIVKYPYKERRSVSH